MYRKGEHPKQNSSSPNENLKQKKRLSFREPEVETPNSNSAWSNTNRIQTLQPKSSAFLAPRTTAPKHSSSLEDLTLEDQTFIVAQHVGQAFDRPALERRRPCTSNTAAKRTSYSDYATIRRNSGFLTETLPNDSSHQGNVIKKSGSNSRVCLSPEDAQCFETLAPALLDMSTMKYPAIEVNENNAAKSNQALVPSTDTVSTSVQHQMQLLKYQLEQQRQQTQAALAHIQLLKDQLQAETSARYKAQTQNHQLMMQNKELLDHMQSLFRQIQDLEKQLGGHSQKPMFLSSSNPLSQEPQNVGLVATTNAATTQGKPNTYAPNSIMAGRRSSMTGLKPFPTRASFLEPNSKRDENKPQSRGSSPTPLSPTAARSPLFAESKSDSARTNSSGGERLFLFGSKQNHEVVREDRKSATEEKLLVVPSLTAKTNGKSESKSPKNSELNSCDERLVLIENPFIIEEKRPGKPEGYSSRNSHSSDRPREYPISKISSLELSPKSYSSWSKTSKSHSNDNLLPLTMNSTPSQAIKESKKNSYAFGSSSLFNS